MRTYRGKNYEWLNYVYKRQSEEGDNGPVLYILSSKRELYNKHNITKRLLKGTGISVIQSRHSSDNYLFFQSTNKSQTEIANVVINAIQKHVNHFTKKSGIKATYSSFEPGEDTSAPSSELIDAWENANKVYQKTIAKKRRIASAPAYDAPSPKTSVREIALTQTVKPTVRSGTPSRTAFFQKRVLTKATTAVRDAGIPALPVDNSSLDTASLSFLEVLSRQPTLLATVLEMPHTPVSTSGGIDAPSVAPSSMSGWTGKTPTLFRAPVLARTSMLPVNLSTSDAHPSVKELFSTQQLEESIDKRRENRVQIQKQSRHSAQHSAREHDQTQNDDVHNGV